MELNQTALRGILAQILSVNEKYIVPKQGNWFNPQEANLNIENWCAYQIKSNKPRTLPFYHEDETHHNTVAVQKIAQIDLQFVGPRSEELANSVSAWPLRGDVKAAFQTVNGAIMNDEYDAISANFMQDGNNSVLSWNVTIQVLWYSLTETSQGQMPAVTFQGNVTKK